MWGAAFFLAIAGTAFAYPNAIFPEDVRRSGARIVSGWDAEEGQFPYQLSLRMVNPAGGVTACGGTVISAEWGLTAAHCTAGRVTVVIRAGTTNLTRPSAIFETTRYLNHPLYNEANQATVQPNDIGLLGFERSITFSDLIQPIRLQRSAAKDQNYAGEKATASGWGNTWTAGTSPEVLNWVYLTITSNDECRAAYGGSAIVADSTICTRGYNDPTQSTCQGDSGGPLTIIDDDGGLTQVGVTSFVSILGCHVGVPSGFVRPGYYHDWFSEVTGIDFDWEYDVTTTAPEDVTTTEAPEEVTTTEAPEDVITTEAPEDVTTTEAPEDVTTTEAPEDVTSTTVTSEESSESRESPEFSKSSESRESPEFSKSSESRESPEFSKSSESRESPEFSKSSESS